MTPDKSKTVGSISSSTLQRQVGTVLRRVAIEKQHLIIERDGFPIAVIMPLEEYNRLVKERAL